MASSFSAPAAAAVDYPSSDGKPMAESDFQLHPLIYAVERLRRYFRNDPDVYVSGNLLIYYEEGNKRKAVAPDVFVVFGARNVKRSSYLLWEEPKGPDFVLEITSRSTWREDQEKRELYRRLGVREYCQYDPTRDYLEPPLQGAELVGREYQPLPVRELADGTLTLRSEVLGLELRLQVAEERLRFHDPQTGQDLPDLAETDDQLLQEAAAHQAEAAARRAAEARARQEATARQREATARQEAEARARQEAAARRAAEARLAEVEALLRRRPDGENG